MFVHTLIMALEVIRKRVAFSLTAFNLLIRVWLSSISCSSPIERCNADPCFPTSSLQVWRSSSLALSGLMSSKGSSSSSSKNRAFCHQMERKKRWVGQDHENRKWDEWIVDEWSTTRRLYWLSLVMVLTTTMTISAFTYSHLLVLD